MTPFPGLAATAVAAALALAAALGAQAAPDPGPAPPGEAPARPAETSDQPPADRPWYERVAVGGLLFGDAFAVVEHHDPEVRDRNGFWIRRVYLTFDFEVAEAWSARLRFEANSPGDFAGGAKLEPFVKDAYLAWKREDHAVLMGISPSPTFDFIEGFWGYRAVEKTPLDLYRMGSSRDFGVAAKGKLAGGRVFYHAMIGNGAGEAAETNEGKKAMLAVGFAPCAAFVVEVYADLEARPGASDRATWQAFAGFRGERGRFGLQVASQQRQAAAGRNETLAVGSVFAVWELSPRATLLGRYDRSFDGNPEADEIPYLGLARDTEFDLALIGLDWKLVESVSLIPNLELVTYREKGGRPAPGDDLIAKLTLYFRF